MKTKKPRVKLIILFMFWGISAFSQNVTIEFGNSHLEIPMEIVRLVFEVVIALLVGSWIAKKDLKEPLKYLLLSLCSLLVLFLVMSDYTGELLDWAQVVLSLTSLYTPSISSTKSDNPDKIGSDNINITNHNQIIIGKRNGKRKKKNKKRRN